VAIVFMASAWYIVLTTYHGARGVEPRFLDVARSFAASRGAVFWKVLMPALYPYLITGARIGLVHAIRAMVVAEMYVIVGYGGLIQRIPQHEHGAATASDYVDGGGSMMANTTLPGRPPAALHEGRFDGVRGKEPRAKEKCRVPSAEGCGSATSRGVRNELRGRRARVERQPKREEESHVTRRKPHSSRAGRVAGGPGGGGRTAWAQAGRVDIPVTTWASTCRRSPR
jgi:hypothetical protein